MSNSQALTDVLTNMRAAAESERDKGTAFERLVKVFLEKDALWGGGSSRMCGCGLNGLREMVDLTPA